MERTDINLLTLISAIPLTNKPRPNIKTFIPVRTPIVWVDIIGKVNTIIPSIIMTIAVVLSFKR